MGLNAMTWAFRTPIENVGAKFLLVALAEHARDDGQEGWTCFPSIKRLSRWTAQGERTIERHLSWLTAEGWISRQVRHDRRRGESGYCYLLHREKAEMIEGDTADNGGAGGKSVKMTAVWRRAFRQSGGDHPPISTAFSAKLAPPYIEEPVIEPVSEPAAPKARDIDVRFSEFWSAFPNKIEERGARAIFTKLIRRGEVTGDTLVEGAKRYAALVLSRERRFVKSPKNWLADGGWADGGLGAVSPIAEGQSTFEGPADVWEAVAARKGDAWAKSYLAPCAWSGSIRALSPRTSFAARKLRDELGRLLRELSIAIIEPATMLGVAHAH